MSLDVAIIVATDSFSGIGKDGKIPWRHSVDMKFFRAMTQHSVCIMGRKTYEDMQDYKKNPFDPLLKNRTCIVVSSTLKTNNFEQISEFKAYHSDGSTFTAIGITYAEKLETGVYLARSVEEAYILGKYVVEANNYNKIFFIGGAKIFEESKPYINRLYLNILQGNYRCDIFLPDGLVKDLCLSSTTKLDLDLTSYEYEKCY